MNEKQKRDKFKELMLQLDVYYIHFKFFDGDATKEKLKLSTWYRALQVIPFENLEYVVNDYCLKNVYAPTSPTSLIEHYKNVVLTSFETAELIFEKVIYNFKIDFDIKKLYNFYDRKGKGYIASTIKQLQSEFELFRLGNIEVSYFKHNFCKIYNDLILKEVNTEKLKIGE